MRSLAGFYLFLSLLASVTFWAVELPVSTDQSTQSTDELAQANFFIEGSSFLELGDALTIRIVSETSALRTVPSFVKSQFLSSSFSGLSALCQTREGNYKKTAFTVDVNFPAFLIIFPHHYFT